MCHCHRPRLQPYMLGYMLQASCVLEPPNPRQSVILSSKLPVSVITNDSDHCLNYPRRVLLKIFGRRHKLASIEARSAVIIPWTHVCRVSVDVVTGTHICRVRPAVAAWTHICWVRAIAIIWILTCGARAAVPVRPHAPLIVWTEHSIDVHTRASAKAW